MDMPYQHLLVIIADDFIIGVEVMWPSRGNSSKILKLIIACLSMHHIEMFILDLCLNHKQ